MKVYFLSGAFRHRLRDFEKLIFFTSSVRTKPGASEGEREEMAVPHPLGVTSITK